MAPRPGGRGTMRRSCLLAPGCRPYGKSHVPPEQIGPADLAGRPAERPERLDCLSLLLGGQPRGNRSQVPPAPARDPLDETVPGRGQIQLGRAPVDRPRSASDEPLGNQPVTESRRRRGVDIQHVSEIADGRPRSCRQHDERPELREGDLLTSARDRAATPTSARDAVRSTSTSSSGDDECIMTSSVALQVMSASWTLVGCSPGIPVAGPAVGVGHPPGSPDFGRAWRIRPARAPRWRCRIQPQSVTRSAESPISARLGLVA